MTTDRTAIRSRLAVRGTAHRPPWGRRKAGHHSIVASVAATVAATVAVGIGVALAKAERERRGARQRLFDRRLGLAHRERLADGLPRMALGQVDLALEQLRSGAGAPGEKAIHEMRKALKRLRAVLRLLENELGENAFERENAALRRTARRLSGARDAEVMLGTLDTLIARHPRALRRRGGVVKLRRRLLAEHTRMQQRTLGDPATRAAVLGELDAVRCRVAAWSLPDRDGIQLIERDLKRLYRQGRNRHRRLGSSKGNEVTAMHEWRKRVKDLRYAAEMLERRASDGASVAGAPDRRPRRGEQPGRAPTDAERLRRLGRRADELGELLGEDHDLAVLAERIRAGRKRGAQDTWRLGRRSRRTLLTLIARRRRKLRRRALRRGERLYRPRPRDFMRRARAAVS